MFKNILLPTDGPANGENGMARRLIASETTRVLTHVKIHVLVYR